MLARRHAQRSLCRIASVALVLLGGSAVQATARQFHTVLQDDRLSLYSPAALHSYMQQVRWLGVDQLRISAEWKLEAPAPDAQSAPAGLRADDPRWYTGPGMRLLDGAVRAASGAGLKLTVDPAF